MTSTRPVRYRQMTADEVLAELRLFCRYQFGFDDAKIERGVRMDSTLADLFVAMHHDDDLSDLAPHFHIKLGSEWWAQWKPDHTVGELCENLAIGTLVPVIEPVTILGTQCETAGAFLTLRQLLADDGADVSELAPSSEVLPYLRAKRNVFTRFRLATEGRLPLFGGSAPWTCLVGLLISVVGTFGGKWAWLIALGLVLSAFGLTRPARYPCLARDRVTTFRDLIHAALGRTLPARAA